MGKQPTGRKEGPRAARPEDFEARLVDAMLDLAASRGWRDVGLAEFAGAAGVGVAELYPDYPSKLAVLVAFIRRTDREVLAAGFKFSPDDTARDRLFEVLMRRFDALRPHREAIRRIRRDLMRVPPEAAALLPALGCSMTWMLTAAEIGTDGPPGRVKAAGLAGVWLRTMAVWVEDDTADMARTMAALDRNLGRAGRWAQLLFGRGTRRRREAA